MTAVTVPASFAAAIIAGYQRFVSPYKGFCCAYRVRRRRASCSEFARRIALRRGVLGLPGLLRERLRRCTDAAQALGRRRDEEKARRSSAAPAGDSCANYAGEACAHASCEAMGEAACCAIDGL